MLRRCCSVWSGFWRVLKAPHAPIRSTGCKRRGFSKARPRGSLPAIRACAASAFGRIASHHARSEAAGAPGGALRRQCWSCAPTNASEVSLGGFECGCKAHWPRGPLKRRQRRPADAAPARRRRHHPISKPCDSTACQATPVPYIQFCISSVQHPPFTPRGRLTSRLTTWGWSPQQCPLPPRACWGAPGWRCGVGSAPSAPPRRGAPGRT